MSSKKLPERFEIKAVSFIDGRNGMASQVFRNEEYGVRVTHYRESRRTPWVSRWAADKLGGQEFANLTTLREAYNRE